MKLTLFSQNFTDEHVIKLKEFFNKDLKDVKILYINTATNYKPYLPYWYIQTENRWRSIFPYFHQFDLERAYKVQPDFDFADHFSKFDYIFFSGGNTFILAYWMEKTGARKLLKELIENEKVVYGGASAGAIITYKDISPAEFADDPAKAPARVNEGLGIVDFATIPHWNNPEFQPALEKIKRIAEDKIIKTYEITDDQALFLNNGQLVII